MANTIELLIDKKKLEKAEKNLIKFEESMKYFKNKKFILKHDNNQWKTD